MTLNKLTLIQYKGFERFTVHFKSDINVMVGPNNAGKSTIISALRLCSAVLTVSKQRKPDQLVLDVTRDRRVRAFQLHPREQGFIDENVHHEFRDQESRIELIFQNKAAIYIVWPNSQSSSPFYYLEHLEGLQPQSAIAARKYYSEIGIIPALSPVEHQETELSARYVKDNMRGRLASRHFRNQLNLTKSDSEEKWSHFLEFLLKNTPEIESLALQTTYSPNAKNIDVFFRETLSHTEKEIYWSGDGMQIWMQFMYHFWRQLDVASLILDEPDVFLHPDLQRRLVTVVEDHPGQVVLATHAPEILSEVRKEAVLIVDRTKRNSKRVNNESVLSKLNDTLGSGFNLKLARALSAKVALFVEGEDMKILKNIARAVGADRLYREYGVSVAKMGGFTNRKLAESFGWLNTNLLDNAVEIMIILDRDYGSDQRSYDICKEFKSAGIRAHVWHKKELESYLLIPELIATVSKGEPEKIAVLIDEAISPMKYSIQSRYIEARQEHEVGADRHRVSVGEQYLQEFEDKWQSPAWRRDIAPPKEVISKVNQELQKLGLKAVSARSLSARIKHSQVDSEMREVIHEIEGLITTK